MDAQSDRPPEQPPAGQAPPARVLRRSRDDRILGGVCGGLGRYLGVDPVVCRLAFVVLVLGAGTGVLVYLLAWLIIPEEKPGEEVGPRPPSGTLTGQAIVGLVLIGVGSVLLARVLFPGVFDSRYVWPSLLVAIGAVIILQGARR